MRNLKRVLSLALATVMLLGMMVMGTSAANVSDFNDSDRIVNVEAATVTTGLGIFEGADGNFMPNEPVTRAQMATIIVKLLYGSNYNADSLKNITLFDDTHNYQGGWAEGYINMCAQMGIVSGYAGTKHFGPGDTVTTAQAALMLMKALGYFDPKNPVNEYGDSWEMSAMIKASYLGLNGNVTMLASEKLTRDNVALLVYNTLQAQLVSYQDSLRDYAKANNHNVTVNNGTVDDTNTLLYNTFHVYVAEGTIVANGITDETLAGKADDPGYTAIAFDETIDMDKDGRKDYSEYDFMYDTGLDMIGHKVDVYYRMDRGNPEVLVMMDKATLVETIRYDAASTTRLANAANALGFRRNTVLNIEPKDYKVNYDLDVTASSVPAFKTGGTGAFNKSLMDDQYIILISNSSNYQVDEIIVLDQFLDQVNNISNSGEYNLANRSGLGRKTVATYDAQAKDYVIVTQIGLRTGTEARYALEPVNAISGNITKLTGVTGKRTLITASGVGYEESPVYYYDNEGKDPDLDNVIDYQTIRDLGETTLLLDAYDNLIAALGEPEVAQYVYVAQFGSQHIPGGSGTLNTAYGLTADVYYADGTHKVLFVDYKNSSFYPANIASNGTESNDARLPSAIQQSAAFDSGLEDGTTANALNGTISGGGQDNDAVHYTWDTALGTTNAARAGNRFRFVEGALGVYTYKMNGDKIQLTAIQGDEAGQRGRTGTTCTTSAIVNRIAGATAFKTGDKFIAGHSTIVRGTDTGVNGRNVGSIIEAADVNEPGKYIRQTNSTVYFYINNHYGDRTFSVKAYTDVNNIEPFTIGADETEPWVVQLFTEAVDNAAYRVATVAVIDNVTKATSPDLYYYNKGNYTVESDPEGGFILTYNVWDKNGDPTALTYHKDTEKKAVSDADGLPTGYYQKGGTNLTKYTVLEGGGVWTYSPNSSNPEYSYAHRQDDKVRYVVNATLHYETYLSKINFFDNVTPIASLIDDDTIIVDTCKSGLESVTDIEGAFENDPECLITISYSYDLETMKNHVLYVTSYRPASSTGTTTKPTEPDPIDANVTATLEDTYVWSKNILTQGQIGQLLRDYYAKDGGTVTSINTRTAPYSVTVNYPNQGTWTMKLHISMGKAVPPADVTLKPVSASPASATTATMQDFMSLTEAEDTMIVLSGDIAEGIPNAGPDLTGIFPVGGSNATQKYFTLGVNLPGVDGTARAAVRIKSAANDPANWDTYPFGGEPGGQIDKSTGYKYWAGIKNYESSVGLAVLAFAGDVIEIEVMLNATGVNIANNTSRGDATGVVEFTGETFVPSYTLYIDTNGVTMVTP